MAERHSQETVADRLRTAGEALYALYLGGHYPRAQMDARLGMVNLFEGVLERGGFVRPEALATRPKSGRRALTEMERTFDWLALIPEEEMATCRVLLLRSLVHPVSRRPLFTWRRIGAVLGYSHTRMQQMYSEGLAIIVRRLNEGVTAPSTSEVDAGAAHLPAGASRPLEAAAAAV